MSPSFATLTVSIHALLLLAICPLSHAGLQAYFFTDSNCTQALQYDIPDATYIDWQELPSSAINFVSGINSTCTTPPAIDLPIPYTVSSGTYNCNVNGSAPGTNTTLYVAEWINPNSQCTPSASNQPDYIYTAIYPFNVSRLNGSQAGLCLPGATYQDKSMTTPMQLWAEVFCIDNGNGPNGVGSTASVSTALVALTVMLAALIINA